MKTFIVVLYLICSAVAGNAQVMNEYAEIDRIALNIPAAQTNTTADIATYINNDFDTDSKKIRAIYAWVTANIKYDKDSPHLAILNEDREQTITAALKRKKGVCENYAAIFNDICIKSGLKSFVIEGYTKQYGSVDKSPHAWCAALIENNWQLYDPTWDAGFAGSGLFTGSIKNDYFQAPPLVFIQSHMPFDPMFQLLDYPVTYNEFSNNNIQTNTHKPYFNYTDSIAAYEKLNPLTQYSATALRMEKNGTPRKMVTNRINQLKMEIEIINQDKDAALYNSAVADYNDALAIFNTFLTYRNNQFIPAKIVSEVQTMFDGIEKLVAAANIKLKEVNRSMATLTLNTSAVEKKLNDLSAHAKEQQVFLRDFLSAAKEK
ncbi:MAG: transglutaminase domain-containing protein [Ginsengibacter sp.]